MRAVVTGGSGFIGSHLIDLLREQGWTTENVDREVGRPIGTEPVPQNVDAIFHLASPVGPVGVLQWAGHLVPEVILCASIVRRWALRNDCPLIYVSTSEVYGFGNPQKDQAEDFSCHFAPETSARKEYAVAKLAAETMLRNTAKLDVRIVRPFNVAGPRQKSAGGFVIPRFIEQARRGEPLTVYAPGTQRRAFGHVKDIAAGILAAYERGKPGEVYNLGNPDNEATILALARLVAQIVGGDVEYNLIDPQTIHGPGFREAPEKLPNIDKAQCDLDWHPWRDLDVVIRDAAMWSTVTITRPNTTSTSFGPVGLFKSG